MNIYKPSENVVLIDQWDLKKRNSGLLFFIDYGIKRIPVCCITTSR